MITHPREWYSLGILQQNVYDNGRTELERTDAGVSALLFQ